MCVLTNLKTGQTTYGVTLTDALGCTATFPFFIKEPDSLRFFAEVQDATDSVSANGSIAIQRVEGGTRPYRYAWSTGSTDVQIGQLRAGTYTAVVRDSAGCESVQRFVVRWLVGTEEAGEAGRRALLIWPNPAWGAVQVSGGVEHDAADRGSGSTGSGGTGIGTQRLRLWDGQGRLVLETTFSAGSGEVWQCTFDLSALPAGVYVAEAENGQRGRVVKL